MHLEGDEAEMAYPSFDIANHRAIPGDPVVVALIRETSLLWEVDHMKRAVDWCITHLPQIDTSKVALWSGSGASGRIMDYVLKYDLSTHVTHAFGTPFFRRTVVDAANFSMPFYVIGMDGDFTGFANRVGVWDLKKVPNMRVTMFKNMATVPPEILASRFGTLSWMNGFQWRHYVIQYALQAYDEFKGSFS